MIIVTGIAIDLAEVLNRQTQNLSNNAIIQWTRERPNRATRFALIYKCLDRKIIALNLGHKLRVQMFANSSLNSKL
jgi:hypothetical protein